MLFTVFGVKIMSEKVLKIDIKKEPGYFYYLECRVCSQKKWVNKKCKTPDRHLWDVWKSDMTPKLTTKKRQTFYKTAGIIKERGYVYYIDSEGDISRFKIEKND